MSDDDAVRRRFGSEFERLKPSKKSMNQVLFVLLLTYYFVSGKEEASVQDRKVHTAYTPALPLSQGEVTNRFHKLKIPSGPIAVYGFAADVVEKNEDGEYVPVPTYDAYLHHHVVGSNHKKEEHHSKVWSPMKPSGISKAIGFGAGTECRGTPQKFNFPYGFITNAGEDSWIANVHIINLRGMNTSEAHKCLECPCHSKLPEKAGGLPWDVCNVDLMEEHNDACSYETYKGGLRCCENNSNCLSSPPNTKHVSTYYLRYTIEYAPVVSENKPLYVAGCCDASGNLEKHGAIEYDIPICDPDLHPGCVHTLSTIQRVNTLAPSVFGAFANNGSKSASSDEESREVDVVFAVGHQHRAGLGISIYDVKTNNLICSSVPSYGVGHGVMNENGYVVSMSTCTFDPPLRMKSNDLVRVTAMYNNTEAHTGVMSLFYLAVSDVETTNSVHNNEAAVSTKLVSSTWSWMKVFAILLIVIAVSMLLRMLYQIRRRRDQQYETILS